MWGPPGPDPSNELLKLEHFYQTRAQIMSSNSTRKKFNISWPKKKVQHLFALSIGYIDNLTYIMQNENGPSCRYVFIDKSMSLSYEQMKQNLKGCCIWGAWIQVVDFLILWTDEHFLHH